LEPHTLLSALAANTSRIGLVGTSSTTYSEPFNIARQLASLDHISRGRAGWNVVTTWGMGAHENFGHERRPDHDLRYQIADEYVDVVEALWDSWEDGALVFDKASAKYVDHGKVHKIDHKGEYYTVGGPLNLSRSPQGRPVIFQAGGSPAGRDFAARWSEAIMSTFETIEDGRAYCEDIKSRAASFGRDPSRIFVMRSMTPYIGGTEEEAQELVDRRAELVVYEDALNHVSKFFDFLDLSGYDPDEPFPDILKPEHLEGSQYHLLNFVNVAKERKLTLRQTCQYFTMPKGAVIGTPEQIADDFESWLKSGAADGFIIGLGAPGQLTVFVDEVVPILRRRGLVRDDYESVTFRENMGFLPVSNRFAGAHQS
jgi:FMN-dependent oxidoreductase (nitrilotriacetate monooxygenase family)